MVAQKVTNMPVYDWEDGGELIQMDIMFTLNN